MNRRLPLLLVAGVLVLCAVGVIVLGVDAGSGFGAVAYTVGDTKVSQQSVNSDLRTLAEHDSFSTQAIAQTFRTTDGAVSSAAAADWLTIEIYRQLGTKLLEGQGKPITDTQRKAAVKALVSQAGPSFEQELKKLPTGLQNKLADVLVVQTELPQLGARGTKITVDPKYGFWDAKRVRVCAPSGCPKASSGSSSSGSSSSGTGG